MYDFAKYLSGINTDDLQNNVLSVITGEARGLAANMEIDEIYADRDEFRKIIWNGVNVKLRPLGLFVHNANIESIEQTDGYFDDKQKFVLANAKAKGLAAEAEADRFAAEKTADADIKIAQYKANVVEEEQKSIQRQKIAEFEARGNYEIRQAEMQKQVEDRNLDRQTVAENVNTLSKARAKAAEIIKTNEGLAAAAIFKATERKTDAEGYAITAQHKALEVARTAHGKRDAYIAVAEGNSKGMKLEAEGIRDANISKMEGIAKAMELEAKARANVIKVTAEADANAVKVRAQADADAKVLIAEATLKEELKRAQGVQANLDAMAKGNKNLIDAFGGDTETFIKDSLIKNDQLVGVTRASAEGMKNAFGPITVWDTGSGGTVDVMKNIIAATTQLKNQTGINILGMLPDFTPKSNKKN